MRTLGVNGAGGILYLAMAEDDRVVDLQPYTFEVPQGLPESQRLIRLRSEASKLVEELGVTRVRVLDAESSYKDSYAALRGRITLETVLMLGCLEACVDTARLSRARTRSLLGLSKSARR